MLGATGAGAQGPQGATGEAGSSFLIGNMLWVDAVVGNDGTAQLERIDLPYATLAAASAAVVAAATNGTTWQAVVRPGNYTVSTTLSNVNVAWYFETGTVVTYNGGAQLFSGGPIVVEGYGQFVAASGILFSVSAAGDSNITIYNFTLTGSAIALVTSGSAVTTFRTLDVSTSSSSNNTINLNGATNNINVSTISSSTAASVITVLAGTHTINHQRILCAGTGISLNSSPGTINLISTGISIETSAANSRAILVDTSPNVITSDMRLASILATGTTSNAIYINNSTNGSSRLRFQVDRAISSSDTIVENNVAVINTRYAGRYESTLGSAYNFIGTSPNPAQYPTPVFENAILYVGLSQPSIINSSVGYVGSLEFQNQYSTIARQALGANVASSAVGVFSFNTGMV